MRFFTKFPEIKETIFTSVAEMALQYDAVNLSQGFPDYTGDPFLLQRLAHYAGEKKHQYAPMSGIPELRQQIAKLHREKVKLDPDRQILVTSGATEALASSLLALVKAGDEVIIFDPSFDCYAPQIKFAGGRPIHLNLKAPDFHIDWDEVAAAITPKTSLILLNFPHNPTGSILKQKDLDTLHQLLQGTSILILSDEVYQYMVFDQSPYVSPAYDKRLDHRTIKIVSFGKMFHVTGWKIGYCIGPENLISEIKKVHQFNTFSSFTPAQYAIADMLDRFPQYPFELGEFYQQKRDFFLANLDLTKWSCSPSQGSYFQLLNYKNISKLSDIEMCKTLIEQHQLATIPISVFYKNPPLESYYLRLCFAKNDKTLSQATQILNAVRV